MFHMIDFAYILTGALIGFLSGMFGIGGSIIGTPVLKVLFGLPSLIALASPLPVTIPTAISGLYAYRNSNKINKTIAKAIIIGGLPSTILGALGTKVVKSEWLMVLTGIFVILVGIRLLKKSSPADLKTRKPKYRFILGILTGFIIGILSGLLAIGGGIMLVPVFILLFGLSMQEAAATSLFCIPFLAIPAIFIHWGLGNIDWNLVLNLSIGVIPTSYAGSKLALSLKSKVLSTIFSVFLILFGIYFTITQLK